MVIVTHQTRDEAIACLESLQRHRVDQIVVVDTGSTDGTAQAIRTQWPEVAVLQLANAGFGRGANAGVRLVDAEIVVIVNADVRFLPDSVARLEAALRADPELGMVGPMVRYPDGRPQASARRLPDGRTALGHALLGRVLPQNRWTRRYRAADADPARPRDADWLSGCALAVRRSAFEAVRGFDPGYHLYVEDLDLGVRLRAAGWRLRFLPVAAVEHRVGASTEARRGWALITHARSLDRYHRRHHRAGVDRALRPMLRVGLAGWVAVTWSIERLTGSRRSTTGERVGPPVDVHPEEVG